MRTRADDEAGYAKLAAETPRGEQHATMRALALRDLYYLLTVVCGRQDMRHDWVHARVREVEGKPDWMLDLWARRHFKTTLVTFGLTLRDILRNRERRVMILSFNKATAVSFMSQLKRELEINELLKWLFPDVLWANPDTQAPRWSERDGIVVRRRQNPKEASCEAYGLVDGQPVGRHPDLVVYDDVVTRDAVSSPEMIAKTTQAFQESLALGAATATRRAVGTRWHYADPYEAMIKAGTFSPRIYPARDASGIPVLLSEDQLKQLWRDMGPAVYSAQMDLDPRKGLEERGFSEQNVRYYRSHNDGHGMNRYIVVDPANSRKRDSSYTAMAVIGLGTDQNYYWLDGLRDRLGLPERIKALFALHRRWKPLAVGYECYGTQEGDIDLIKAEQERINYRFTVIPLRGRESKDDRIPRLEPSYAERRWYWPEKLLKTRAETGQFDLVQEFLHEEYLAYPYGRHPDMLDAMSRILDPDLLVTWPKPEDFSTADLYEDAEPRGSAWAA